MRQRIILAAEVANAEFAAGMTALSERTYFNPEGVRSLRAATSADGRWGYEREGRTWVAFPRRSDPLPTLYARSISDIRRNTFEHDHPMHGPEREPRPFRIVLA